MALRITLLSMGFVVLLSACGGSKAPESTQRVDSRSKSVELAPQNADPWAGKTVIAGRAGARFSFPVPAGLQPLEDITQLELQGQNVLFDTGSAGSVGKYENGYVAFDTIEVFSDPEGLGVNYGSLSKEDQDKLRARYEGLMKERYPDAASVQVVEVGGRPAFRLDLRIVRTEDLPLRAGRHYLLIDGNASVSIECLWVPSDSAQMGAACDAVAQEIKRVE